MEKALILIDLDIVYSHLSQTDLKRLGTDFMSMEYCYLLDQNIVNNMLQTNVFFSTNEDTQTVFDILYTQLDNPNPIYVMTLPTASFAAHKLDMEGHINKIKSAIQESNASKIYRFTHTQNLLATSSGMFVNRKTHERIDRMSGMYINRQQQFKTQDGNIIPVQEIKPFCMYGNWLQLDPTTLEQTTAPGTPDYSTVKTTAAQKSLEMSRNKDLEASKFNQKSLQDFYEWRMLSKNFKTTTKESRSAYVVKEFDNASVTSFNQGKTIGQFNTIEEAFDFAKQHVNSHYKSGDYIIDRTYFKVIPKTNKDHISIYVQKKLEPHEKANDPIFRSIQTYGNKISIDINSPHKLIEIKKAVVDSKNLFSRSTSRSQTNSLAENMFSRMYKADFWK